MQARRFMLVLPIALAAGAAHADVYLIAHPALRITPEEAVEVFLGDRQLAGPLKVVPFDNAAVQGEFLQKAFQMSHGKYTTLWAKKAFRDGLNAPAVKGNDLEVLQNVRITPGALGYVSAPGPGVAVIRKY